MAELREVLSTVPNQADHYKPDAELTGDYRRWSKGAIIARVRELEAQLGPQSVTNSAGRKKAGEILRKQGRELQDTRRELEHRTLEAERRAAQLRALTLQLGRAEERERRRLAELLHDHLQQLLVAARMKAELIHAISNEANVKEHVGAISQLLRESIAASRSLTRELSPPVLHDQGLVSAVEWLTREYQQKYGLTVQVHADTDLPYLDQDTRSLLFHAVRELLFNVIKHAKTSDASITVQRRPRGEVQIVVKDQGVGMADPAAVYDSQEGAFGLLAIRERLQCLSGSLTVRSFPNRGTTVTLRLPVQSADGMVSAKTPAKTDGKLPAVEPHRQGKIHVLLVDDHETVRAGLASLLEAEPDIVVAGQASNAQMALDLVMRRPVDVAVMDISMPGINGIEATRRMRVIAPQVRVVGLSMHEESDMAASMLAAGAVRYVAKGGPCNELLSAIRDAAPKQVAAT